MYNSCAFGVSLHSQFIHRVSEEPATGPKTKLPLSHNNSDVPVPTICHRVLRAVCCDYITVLGLFVKCTAYGEE